MRVAKVQASLRIRAVSPEPSLLAHISRESRETFRQKARSLAPLNGWACAVKIYHDGMLEDTNSLDGAHIIGPFFELSIYSQYYMNGVRLYTFGRPSVPMFIPTYPPPQDVSSACHIIFISFSDVFVLIIKKVGKAKLSKPRV